MMPIDGLEERMAGAFGEPCRGGWRNAARAWLVVLLVAMGGLSRVAAQPSQGEWSRYEIDATLDDRLDVIHAEMSLSWLNTTGGEQAMLPFRLYPNAAYYGNGALTVLEATVDGEPVAPDIAADPTVMELPLPEPVAPGGRATIAMRFQTGVPTDATGSLGILQRDGRDVWSLSDWYPIVAGYEPDAGWYLEPPTDFGDPTLSETADYEVRLRAPSRYTVLGSGSESIVAQDDGTALTTLSAPMSREFAMTLLPEVVDGAGLATTEATVGNTTLALTLPRSMLVPGLREVLLETAVAAFPVYESWLGDYPGENVNLTTADLAGASGVSWAGLIWLDLEPFLADGELNELERIRLRFVITHEIGHQWIGNIIGANTNDHQFLGEGLVNTLTIAVFREVDGDETAERYLRADLGGAYLALLKDGRDGVADVPISGDLNGVLHGIMIYGKAGVGFEALRQEIGNDAFFGGIADYAETFRFGLAGPDNLLAALEGASGADLDAQWVFWFEQEETTVSDVEAVFDTYPGN